MKQRLTFCFIPLPPEYTFGSFNLQFMTITKRLIFKHLWYQCTSRITSNYEFAAHLCVPIVNNYLHLILSINRERAFWFSYKSLSNWPITFHLTLVAYRYILYSVNWSSIVRKQFHHNSPPKFHVEHQRLSQQTSQWLSKLVYVLCVTVLSE